MKPTIGFIGQGWIGKHYADDFEARSYPVVRYALEEPYIQNKDSIATCDITFIAVPTPTTPQGFDSSYLRSTLSIIGKGKIAVIKSTLTPGLTTLLQGDFPLITILHSPEFLVEKTAAFDAANPMRNIVGIPVDTATHQAAASAVHAVLPPAPYQVTIPSTEAELIKYAGNCFLYTKVVFMNALHDLVSAYGADYNRVAEAMSHDPRIGISHMQPVHQSGRGAGGHCFIKDFEAFIATFKSVNPTDEALPMLEAIRDYNLQLLRTSGKDANLVRGVYGD